jgi:hypothetical protein
VPVQLIQRENVRGPLIVAADCNGVGIWKVAVEEVMLAMQPVQGPEGGNEVRVPVVPDVAR